MNLYFGKAIDDNSNETKKVILTERILLLKLLFKKNNFSIELMIYLKSFKQVKRKFMLT